MNQPTTRTCTLRYFERTWGESGVKDVKIPIIENEPPFSDCCHTLVAIKYTRKKAMCIVCGQVFKSGNTNNFHYALSRKTNTPRKIHPGMLAGIQSFYNQLALMKR